MNKLICYLGFNATDEFSFDGPFMFPSRYYWKYRFCDRFHHRCRNLSGSLSKIFGPCESPITIPTQDSAVEDLKGTIHLFRNPKNPNQVWGYFQVSVVLTHWLVYESIPERLLYRETGDRIRIILENYQNFENTK
jgi:hypothetical protein